MLRVHRTVSVGILTLSALTAGVFGLPGSAAAFTAEAVDGRVVVSSGGGNDDVVVSTTPAGEPVVEVLGQALEGPSPCVWDEEEERLRCPIGTALRIELGDGSDVLDSSGGVDVVAVGGAAADSLDGASESHGGDGDDVIVVGAVHGTRRAFGGEGSDTIEVGGSDGGDVRVEGGPGSDLLDASAASGAAVTLVGGDGADELLGAASPSLLDGGAGDDTIDDGGATGSTVTAGPGADSITASGRETAIDAGDGDDEIDATSARGPIKIEAGEGADAVRVVTAGSRVNAGPGADAIDAAGATGAIGVDGGMGDDRIEVSGDGSWVHGGDGRDVIDAGTAVGTVRLHGDAGDDQIVLGGVGSTASGDDGSDLVDASAVSGTARIDGGSGPDRLIVGGSGTVALGGGGDDQLDGADAGGPVVLDGGDGNDVIGGGDHADTLRGGEGDDRLDGGIGRNTLDGGAGSDTLLAGAAPSPGETLAGGEGLDVVSYENASDGVTVSVGSGADDGATGEGDDVRGDVERVDGSDGDDALAAGPSGTTLVGAEGDDRLVGGVASDVLIGGPGDDHFDGGPGVVPDAFDGGAGVDELAYAGRTAPLRIDMASREPHGGEAGERDAYRDAIERIVGGAGADVIQGQPGVPHVIVAGAGDDLIRVREARGAVGDVAGDAVRCQGGRDRVDSDRFDTTARDCERVVQDGALTRALTVFPRKLKVVVSRDGDRIRVRLGCDRETLSYCATTVVVRQPGSKRTLARVERVRISRGRWRTVRIAVKGERRAATLLRTKRVLVVVVARDKIGRGSIAKQTAARTSEKPTATRGSGKRAAADETGSSR